MKHLSLVILLIAMQFAASGKNLEAFFSYCTFYSPESGPYVETYLSIAGHSVQYRPKANNALQGNIEVTYIFKKGDEIVNFKKFTVLSPELSDTNSGYINFLDQQRIQIPNGEYQLEILLDDKNSEEEATSALQPLNISYSNSKVEFSEIQLLESYTKSATPGMITKSGYDLVPYVSDFFPGSMENIAFYAEIYNTDYVLGADSKFLVKYHIESFSSGRSLGNFSSFLRKNSQKVNVVLSQFKLADLPTGDYNLVMEVVSSKNEKIAEKKVFFHRENPATSYDPEQITASLLANSFAGDLDNQDTLSEFIRTLAPISNDQEKRLAKVQYKEGNLESMQQYFLAFWMNRNSTDPEVAWLKYKREVHKTNEFFSTSIKKGYETDRGRIYLKYGPPNTRIQRKNDPGSYPYEIWHYYSIDVRSDAKFIFFDNDLITNDYELLHSNVRGEVSDFRWQVRLQKRSGLPSNLDNGTTQDQFGNPAQDLFDNPR